MSGFSKGIFACIHNFKHLFISKALQVIQADFPEKNLRVYITKTTYLFQSLAGIMSGFSKEIFTSIPNFKHLFISKSHK